MISFLEDLASRNQTLYYFGNFCFALALLFLILSSVSKLQIQGVSAWNKPLKFALSLGVYSWTMAWYCFYLPDFNLVLFNWTVVIMWSFEIMYIAIQAGRGQLSHYNVANPVYAFLYALMAIAATVVTLYTAYIGFLFFHSPFPQLPDYYLWAIRLGILIFVVFSFEGFAMGSRLNHSVGDLNNNSNLFILAWSKTVGDLRVSHFIGMHALQVLPFLSFYVFKNTALTLAMSLLYAALALYTLMQALKGEPFIKNKT